MNPAAPVETGHLALPDMGHAAQPGFAALLRDQLGTAPGVSRAASPSSPTAVAPSSVERGGVPAVETVVSSAAATPVARPTGEVPTVTLGEMLRIQATRTLPLPAQPVVPDTAGASPVVPSPRAFADGGRYVMPVEGRVSSGFGMRVHPVLGTSRMHNGVDIAAPEGTPIRSAAAGTVTFAGWQGGYGNIVIIKHPDGSETRYAHQSRMSVATGDRVAQGQVIGAVGSTGMSTGPHLHFEIRVGGEPIDPEPLLA